MSGQHHILSTAVSRVYPTYAPAFRWRHSGRLLSGPCSAMTALIRSPCHWINADMPGIIPHRKDLAKVCGYVLTQLNHPIGIGVGTPLLLYFAPPCGSGSPDQPQRCFDGVHTVKAIVAFADQFLQSACFAAYASSATGAYETMMESVINAETAKHIYGFIVVNNIAVWR